MQYTYLYIYIHIHIYIHIYIHIWCMFQPLCPTRQTSTVVPYTKDEDVLLKIRNLRLNGKV